MNESRSVTPIPDPTLLTTKQLEREVEHLKELVAHQKELFTARLADMDKAVQLLQATANRSPTINEVFLRHQQRFKTIMMQFSERDVRTEQSVSQAKLAVDAALQSAKEAVAKSELSTTKQIDQIGVIMAQGLKASDEKIDDLKERVSGIEGRRGGVGDAWGYIVGGLGLAVAIVALLLSHSDKETVYVPAPQASKP